MAYESALEQIRADAASHKTAIEAIGIIIAAIFGVLYFSYVRDAVFVAAFIAIGVLSRLWQRFFPAPIGANLIMLFTVISGVQYGSFAGVLVGVLSLLISAVIVQDEMAAMAVPLLATALIGYLAGILPISASNISVWGLALTAAYDFVVSVAYLFFGLANINTVIFVITHIIFNYFVFFNLAPGVMSILA